jgi:diketogulonate reductase-like aldo/keto reductase
MAAIPQKEVSNLLIPSIGCGTYQLLDNDAYRSVLFALKYGYRHIDTAVLYKNEEHVGRAIKDSLINRDEIFITTKVHNKDQLRGRDRIKKKFKESLEKLQVKHVNLLLLHNPILSVLEESWNTLVELYNEGLCKMIGVSNFIESDMKYFENPEVKIKPMVNQFELSPFNTREDLVNLLIQV